MFNRPVAISLSPNTQFEDVVQAVKMVVQPWSWKKGTAVKKVEKWFASYFDKSGSFSFNSGRSAFYALLKFFGIGEGDEVIIQSFTCVAVPNAIKWTGARVKYADVDETLNIDSKSIEKLISPKTKAIIVQHTFGIPAKMDMITKITQKNKLVLIEDCSHALGAKWRGKKIGSFGDAAFFSFGRDKVISSVFGGMAILNQRSKIKDQKLREFQKDLEYPSFFWILQQLIHPIIFALILPLYNLSIGKLILLISQKIGLLGKPVYEMEKRGHKPAVFPALYPNALAKLLLPQLKKLDRFNQARQKNAEYYFENLKNSASLKLPARIDGAIYLRFNLLTPKAEIILREAKRQGILLGNWYRNIIDPKGVLYEKIGFWKKSCPKAEKFSTLSCNLPTYPSISKTDLDKIIKIVSNYAS